MQTIDLWVDGHTYGWLGGGEVDGQTDRRIDEQMGGHNDKINRQMGI